MSRYPFAAAVDAYFGALEVRQLAKDTDAPWSVYAAAFDQTVVLADIVSDCIDVAIGAGAWPPGLVFWGGE